MNQRVITVALLASMLTASACAAEIAGPQLGESFRIVKPDGNTIIQQGKLGSNVLTGTPITISEKDAFLVSGGKCAFNVKYDEISPVAVTGTTNRLYSNDALIAQNSMINLLPGVLKTIWTQPYLVAGVNNVRVVVNADGAAPSTKWIRIYVTGTCTGVTEPVKTAPAPATPVRPSEPVTKPAPPVTVKPAPVVIRYAPGTTQWNNVNNIWGYSNYATTQLKNANYPRYAELVKLNAAVTAIVNAKTIEQGAYNNLIVSWNTIATDVKFKSLMAAVLARGDGKR